MSTQFIEQDCTIHHEGRSFTSGGSVVTDDYIIAYCNKDMTAITTWHGEFIGAITSKQSWRIHSYVSNRMYQIYAKVNGKFYTGRTLGAGMIAKLRPVK